MPIIRESESTDEIVIRNGWNHDVTITEGMTFYLATLYAEAQADQSTNP